MLYTTVASRQVCVDADQRFITAQKPSWWTGMEALLAPHVKDPGDSAFAWNPVLKQVVCCHFDPGRGGKRKFVVSNAFAYRQAPNWNPLNPPVYSEYAATFSVCDKFNHALSNNWYPYRAGHWEKHFELVFLSIAFMNFYAACLHLNVITSDVSFKRFLVDSGVSLAKIFFAN